MTLPPTMKCIEIPSFGGPELLTLAERPLPTPKAGEVLIKVEAAGVNRPDVIQRQGMYPPPPGASDIPGLEVAGKVVALGEGVSRLQIGQPICALLTGGGYAEYATAAEAVCLPIPAGYDMVQASAVPETFFTVWYNVFMRCHLAPGESFLVHGGTSGIGTTAIQLAKHFGSKVFTTAGSAEKCASCLELGADRAIDYRTEDFVEVIAAETGKKGVDVILDMVGGDYLPRNIKSLATDGRHASIAFLRGPKAEVNFLPVMLKRLTLTGSTLRPQAVPVKAAIAAELLQKVWPLLDQGKVKPVIHATFPLAEAAEAHRLMEASTHVGKIVLTL